MSESCSNCGAEVDKEPVVLCDECGAEPRDMTDLLSAAEEVLELISDNTLVPSKAGGEGTVQMALYRLHNAVVKAKAP